VKGKAALRNRQVAGEPLNVTVFDRTVIVNSIGTLNSENCELKVDNVTIENDFQNIVTNLLKANSDIIGKVIEVPDCNKFLD
jgi:Glu-tRNA(Gln) amidotransferase subunit E-like FAD-binding protein